MKKVKVLGYFKDELAQLETDEKKNINEKLLYFVAFKNSTIDNSKKWIEIYNIFEGHFELKDEDYLKFCNKITKEQYKQATKGYYTPIEYM